MADDKLRRSLIRWAWADKLPMFSTSSVQAITISHALMYLPDHDRQAMMMEFARVLQPGGVVRILEGDHPDRDSARVLSYNVDPLLLAHQMREVGLCPAEVNANTTHYAAPDSGIRRSRAGFTVEGVQAPCERLARDAPLRSGTAGIGMAGPNRAILSPDVDDVQGANPGAAFWEEREAFSPQSPGVVRLILDDGLATVGFLPDDDAEAVAIEFCSTILNSGCVPTIKRLIDQARAAGASSSTEQPQAAGDIVTATTQELEIGFSVDIKSEVPPF